MKPATLQPVTYTLPAYWASYLINGDDSGISPEDKAACDAFHAARGLPSPVSCGDTERNPETGETGDPWFAHSNDAGTLAGDVWDYTYLIAGGAK